MTKRYFSWIILVCFFCTSVLGPDFARAQAFSLPAPGAMVSVTPAYMPVMMKGLKIHPDNPLLFDFILDTGKSGLKVDGQGFKAESEKLIKYFLASLTIKEENMWVNLSPVEKDRVIADDLGKTELGRDMLAQDYVLKQLTASLIYPENGLGKTFWAKVYAQAQAKFGTTDIPVDTFNKVWITGDRARVLERDNAGYVVAMHLKVMLESDYLAARHSERSEESPVAKDAPQDDVAKQVIREIILPAIEKEVNEGANFASLRQIFSSMILAAWYKKALKDALLNQVYTNKGKTGGVESDDPALKGKIYAQYLEAYKKGVFNYIKEEANPATGGTMPRKYFSGGVVPGEILKPSVTDHLADGDNAEVVGNMAMVMTKIDQAQTVKLKNGSFVPRDVYERTKLFLQRISRWRDSNKAAEFLLMLASRKLVIPEGADKWKSRDGFLVFMQGESFINEILPLLVEAKLVVVQGDPRFDSVRSIEMPEDVGRVVRSGISSMNRGSAYVFEDPLFDPDARLWPELPKKVSEKPGTLGTNDKAQKPDELSDITNARLVASVVPSEHWLENSRGGSPAATPLKKLLARRLYSDSHPRETWELIEPRFEYFEIRFLHDGQNEVITERDKLLVFLDRTLDSFAVRDRVTFFGWLTAKSKEMYA